MILLKFQTQSVPAQKLPGRDYQHTSITAWCKEWMDRGEAKHANCGVWPTWSRPGTEDSSVLRGKLKTGKCYGSGHQRHEPMQAGKAVLEANLRMASVKNNSQHSSTRTPSALSSGIETWNTTTTLMPPVSCKIFSILQNVLKNAAEQPSYCCHPSLHPSSRKTLTWHTHQVGQKSFCLSIYCTVERLC